ncbi:unnamed protein product [Fusarium equiseti]|uniref:Ubiquitin-like domain-containing protein n=1 Tax=Fusarium equiseti TaxID=61235 RepID=A0A8J2J3U2_FUSEQ|nr:unnamed protein product [Fusarium equiseti]
MEQGHSQLSTVPTLSSLCHSSDSTLNDIVKYAETLKWGTICVTLEDEQGWFRIWASNLGALQPAESMKSLDRRLSDAPLMRKSVASGLERLQLSAKRGESRMQARTVCPEALLTRFALTALAILNKSAPNRSISGGDAKSTTELDELLLSLRSAINHLFGLSILIRRQRPRGRLPELEELTLESSPDISYLTDRFPKTKSNIWLARRLGNNITRQRRLIQYRQHHRESLAKRDFKGSDPADTATIVATTFHEGDKSSGTHQTPQDADSSRMSIFTSATSFLSLEDGTTTGRSIPDLSDMILDGVQLDYGKPFECPYCRTIQNPDTIFGSAEDLKKHLNNTHAGIVTEAQMPLILETCERPIKSFGSNSCPLCTDWEPPSMKENAKSFSRHLARHLQQLALEALPLAIDGLEVRDASGLSDEESSLSYGSGNEEALRNQPHDPPSAFMQGEDGQLAVDMAAALEDAGFNPDIVIDHPKYRRRDSLPGVQEADSDSHIEPSGKAPVAPEAAESIQMDEALERWETAVAANDAIAAEVAAAEVAAKKAVEKLKKRIGEELDPAAPAEDAWARELRKKFEEEVIAKLEDPKKKVEKAPVRFKDAVGRKFSFPFHLCATWQGMEDLIKQAFMQVDVLGPHVMEGHYDLTGPGGEIILPSAWEKVIQPGMAITMTMWPIDRTLPLPTQSASPPYDLKPPPPPIGPKPPSPEWVRRKQPKRSGKDSESSMAGFLFGKPPKKKKAVPSSSADQQSQE